MIVTTWSGSRIPLRWRLVVPWLRGWFAWCSSADVRQQAREIRARFAELDAAADAAANESARRHPRLPVVTVVTELRDESK